MIKDLILWVSFALCIIGPCAVCYLSYQKFLKGKNIFIRVVVPIPIFIVTYIIIFLSLLAVGAIPFSR